MQREFENKVIRISGTKRERELQDVENRIVGYFITHNVCQILLGYEA
jgi:hypothetical protein